MTDFAMLSLFFMFFLTTFVFSIVMVVSESVLRKETTPKTMKIKPPRS